MQKPTRFFIAIFLVLVYFINSSSRVNAVVTCTASVTPTESQPNISEKIFSFTINNTSGADYIQWLKITKPLSGLSFISGSIADWTKSFSSDSLILQPSGDALSAGASLSPTITIGIGDIGGQSGNWTIEASDWYEGNSPISCTGSLGLTISAGAADTTAPIISDISVSNITTTSVVISWSTNEASDSLVNYGIDYAGPYSNSNATLTTSHSLTLTQALAANTAYTYQVCSKDVSNNQGCSPENNFTTSSSTTATSTPTPTTTTTTTTTTTPTPSTTSTTARPTDSVKPTISITTDLSEPFEQAPLIEGNASDNNTLTAIEYSVDSGLNWQPVDNIENPNTKSSTFNFTPLIVEDGNYDIIARAIDGFNNIGESSTQVLVLDRLPPEVGGNVLALGPHPLKPNANGAIISMVNLAQKITLSTVGGATSVDLLANDRMFSLARSAETGLWSGALNFDTPGVYQLSTRAIDGAGNETERDLNPVIVVRSGRITKQGSDEKITEGSVELFYQDPQAKVWTPWDAEAFGQDNPQKLSDGGEYQYFVPPGTYYLRVKSKGLATLTSRIFSVSDSTPINADFSLKVGRQIIIGPFSFTLPDFLNFDKANITITAPPSINNSQFETLIDSQIPLFTLPTTESEDFDVDSLIGQPAVVTLFSSWAPAGIEQISLLADAYNNREIAGALIAVQENPSKIAIFKKRGNYEVPIVVDRDGTLVSDYKFTSVPTHYFIDRKGDIKAIITGVLTADEIKSHLEAI